MLAAVTAHNGPNMVPASDPVTTRLDANRRRFQPRTGRYVTFDDLRPLARVGTPSALQNARSGAGLTSFTLAKSTTEQ
jgi:polyhydroxyalkanoate synthesis regulator protein